MARNLIQCDFDDTVTHKDVSLLLLNEFAGPEWRDLWEHYQAGKISVGRFNELAFGLVKANRRQMLEYIEGKYRLRPGFVQFVQYCRSEDIRFVIVSNGLDFYIQEILNNLGLPEVEYHAAETAFHPQGLKVRYVSHDGVVLDKDFKASYTQKFIRDGYHVTYIGDGNSDLAPARLCHRVFATANLLILCRENGLACIPFMDFNDILKELTAR